MKVWRLGSCENFVGKREELVLDAFIDIHKKTGHTGLWQNV